MSLWEQSWNPDSLSKLSTQPNRIVRSESCKHTAVNIPILSNPSGTLVVLLGSGSLLPAPFTFLIFASHSLSFFHPCPLFIFPTPFLFFFAPCSFLIFLILPDFSVYMEYSMIFCQTVTICDFLWLSDACQMLHQTSVRQMDIWCTYSTVYVWWAYGRYMSGVYIVTCQVHRVFVKNGSNVRSVSFLKKCIGSYC